MGSGLACFRAVLASLALTAAAQESGAQGPAALPQSADLIIAATTDVHGRVRGWDYYSNSPDSARGLTRAATIVDSVRAANPGRVILVDAGDLLQGNPFAYVAARDSSVRPNPIIAAMNAMRYDAAAIGNHEFRYGLPYLDSAIAQATFPFLSDNVYRTDGAHAYHPWSMVTRAGVKVALIGATTPGVVVWEPANIRGRLTLGDMVSAVRQSVMEVQAAGADVIVVIAHTGLDEASNYDTVRTRVPSENVAARIATEIPAVDVVVYGHSHKEMREKMIGTTLLVEPRNFAANVSIVHVGVVRAGSRWAVSSKRGELVQATRHVESPALLLATAAAHQKTVAYFSQPLGTTAFDWRADSSRLKDTPIIDFVLEVQRKASDAQLAATSVYNSSARIEPGSVTRAQLANLYPYDNTVRTVRVTGKQLREYLEHSARYYTGRLNADSTFETDAAFGSGNFDIVSGVDYVIDLTKPAGSRITRLEYKGTPLSNTDSFTMALNNYRFGGAGGYTMLRGAPVVYEGVTEIGDLLVAEVQQKGALDPANYFVQNWTIIPPAGAR